MEKMDHLERHGNWKIEGAEAAGEVKEQKEETKSEGGDRQQKMKVIETPIFVPFTQDSVLRKTQWEK